LHDRQDLSRSKDFMDQGWGDPQPAALRLHNNVYEKLSVDSKDLIDIPHYWPQRKAPGLPRYQFIAREIRSGMMFLADAPIITAC